MDKTDLNVAEIYTMVADFVVRYAFQLLGALVLLAAGALFARWLSRLIIRVCEKREMDPMLARFFGAAAKAAVLVFVVIAALGKFGISIGPLVAALGALTLGASFAVQGLLSNYGAGLAIILTRPFTLGHTITVKGVRGIVEDIHLGITELTTEDGERILIPNKHIVGEIITNSGKNSLAELSLGISYADDPEKATAVILETLAGFPEISREPPPQAGVDGFADSAVTMCLRYWIPTRQYFQLRYRVNLAVYAAVREAGITIPFPQMDLHMKKAEA